MVIQESNFLKTRFIFLGRIASCMVAITRTSRLRAGSFRIYSIRLQSTLITPIATSASKSVKKARLGYLSGSFSKIPTFSPSKPPFAAAQKRNQRASLSST